VGRWDPEADVGGRTFAGEEHVEEELEIVGCLLSGNAYLVGRREEERVGKLRLVGRWGGLGYFVGTGFGRREVECLELC